MTRVIFPDSLVVILYQLGYNSMVLVSSHKYVELAVLQQYADKCEILLNDKSGGHKVTTSCSHYFIKDSSWCDAISSNVFLPLILNQVQR